MWSALAVLLLAAPAGATITRRHTAAGTALARAVLLGRADFGRGWTQEAPPPHKVGFLTCSQFSPSVGSAVEVGSAASPTRQRSSYGPFVSQTVYAYATARQADTVWHAIVRPGLVRCLAATVKENSGSKVTHEGALRLPGISGSAAGYRVAGTLSAPGGSVDIYVDMIVLGHGTAMSALVLSSFQQPVAQALELRLARAVSRHLGAA